MGPASSCDGQLPQQGCCNKKAAPETPGAARKPACAGEERRKQTAVSDDE